MSQIPHVKIFPTADYKITILKKVLFLLFIISVFVHGVYKLRTSQNLNDKGLVSGYTQDIRLVESTVGNARNIIDIQSVAKGILEREIPVLAASSKNEEYYDDIEIVYGKKSETLWHSILASVFNFTKDEPRSFFNDEIPLFAMTSSPENVVFVDDAVPKNGNGDSDLSKTNDENGSLDNETKAEIDRAVNGKDFQLYGKAPIVAIYHTHSSELYAESGNDAHASGGKRGDVVKVGAVLAKTLYSKGIPVIHATTVHDFPNFRESYRRSLVTAKKIMADYPSVKIIIDLHRDAGPRSATVTALQGHKSAKCMFVVGTDKMGLYHPNWRTNMQFAEMVSHETNALYPGLSRGIKMSAARYNQHVSTHAILIEVGGNNNSLQEALFAGKCLSNVIAKTLKNK